MTAAEILARARIGCRVGDIQSSADGVRDPAHLRQLYAEEARDNAERAAHAGERIAALERENAELRAVAGPMLRLRAEVAALSDSWVDKMNPKRKP
jgi:hypothetical protein